LEDRHALRRGRYDLPFDEAVTLAKEEYGKEIHDFLDSLAEDELLQFLGDDRARSCVS